MKKKFLISMLLLNLIIFAISPLQAAMSPQEKLEQAQQWVKTETGQPWVYKALGYALFNLERYKEANFTFSRVETLFGKPDPEAINGQAYCLNAMGKKEEALILFERAASLKPSEGKYNDIAQIEFSIGKKEKALSSFQRGIKYLQDKDRADSYNGKGFVFYSQKKYEEALLAFRKAAMVDPQKADIPNTANTLIQLGRDEEALKLLEASYKKDRKISNIAESLGFQYIKIKQLKKARKVFEENLKEHPDALNSMRGLASISISEKKLLEASRIYEKIIERGETADDYITFGQIETQLGNTRLALEAYKTAYRKFPDSSKTTIALGYALARDGNKKEAMAMFRKAFAINPDTDSYVGLAFGLMTNGNYSQAAEALDRAIALNPDSAQAHYYRGLLWLDLGEKEMALRELERLSHLDKDLTVLFRKEFNSR